MSINSISIGLDTSKLDQDIMDTENRIKELSQNITNVARKGFNTVVILGQITGNVIDQGYQLLAQAAFIAAETITQISAAQSLTVVGAVQATISMVAVAGLLATGAKLLQKQGSATVEIQGLISLANEWRF